jgi:hypothetical protein
LREELSCGLDVEPEVAIREGPNKKENMKIRKLQLAILAAGLAVAMSASATIYSDTAFSTMSSYNGTYVPGSPGYEHLAYTSAAADAVVGVVGPLGTLNSLSMSFVFSNPVGTGNAPFAAFGISDNSTWVAGSDRLDVISENGNLLIGTSLVHVWDWNLNSGAGGDVAGMSGVTLNSILATYGTWEVMRAYAYIGDTGGSSDGSVDINSITVGAYVAAVPEPTTIIAGAMLLLPFGASTLRILRKSRAA